MSSPKALRFLLALLLLSASLSALAQEPREAAATQAAAPEATKAAAAPLRPVSEAFMLEGGSSHLLDTYLSPLKYTGWNVAFSYERRQAMKFSPALWRQQLNLRIEASGAHNPAGNATLYYGNISAAWSMARRWQLPLGIRAEAGGMAQFNVGGMYNRRNGNNPAALKTDLTLGVIGAVSRGLRIGRLPVTLRWQSALPIVGALFSPEYDELYFEMYLGNRHGLVHCAWPGNFFRWDNLVTADIGLGNTALRLGFRSDIYSQKVNHITTRNFSYAFVLGVVTDFISVSPRRSLPSGNNVEWAY